MTDIIVRILTTDDPIFPYASFTVENAEAIPRIGEAMILSDGSTEPEPEDTVRGTVESVGWFLGLNQVELLVRIDLNDDVLYAQAFREGWNRHRRSLSKPQIFDDEDGGLSIR